MIQAILKVFSPKRKEQPTKTIQHLETEVRDVSLKNKGLMDSLLEAHEIAGRALLGIYGPVPPFEQHDNRHY